MTTNPLGHAGADLARISRKRVHMYMSKGVGVHFADFISFFLISHEKEIIWSH